MWYTSYKNQLPCHFRIYSEHSLSSSSVLTATLNSLVGWYYLMWLTEKSNTHRDHCKNGRGTDLYWVMENGICSLLSVMGPVIETILNKHQQSWDRQAVLNKRWKCTLKSLASKLFSTTRYLLNNHLYSLDQHPLQRDALCKASSHPHLHLLVTHMISEVFVCELMAQIKGSQMQRLRWSSEGVEKIFLTHTYPCNLQTKSSIYNFQDILTSFRVMLNYDASRHAFKEKSNTKNVLGEKFNTDTI